MQINILYIDKNHCHDKDLFILAIYTVGNLYINIIYTQTLCSFMALYKQYILVYVYMYLFRQLGLSYLLSHTHICTQVMLGKTTGQR